MGFNSLHNAQTFFVLSLELLMGILFSESKSPTPNGMGDQVEFFFLLHLTEQPPGDVHKAERFILFQVYELRQSARPVRF